MSSEDKHTVDESVKRKVKRKYTIDDLIDLLPQYMTPNAKIVTSLSIRVIDYVVLKYLSEYLNTSMSDIVNAILDKAFNDCENMCNLIDNYYNTLFKKKENSQ